MSITAIKGQRGEEQALCGCDACSAEIVVSARHGDSARHKIGGKPRATLHSEALVIVGLRKIGWSYVRNKLRCPKCEAARVEKQTLQQEPKMAEQTAPRTMTADMRMDIMEVLFDAYDRKLKRYKGEETDKTVAEAVGGGCMPGWVSEVRAENFGPAGNEEIDAIRSRIAEVKADHDKMLASLSADFAKQLQELSQRVDACVSAHDKRVRA